jgi:hypothetical protein
MERYKEIKAKYAEMLRINKALPDNVSEQC